jgi:cobalt/nickel transport system permease protein
MSLFPILWAVHIADGVLGWPWLLAGFILIGVLALAASWRVSEEEVPRIALMTAAFFVASSIHVKLGPSSAHLLLNGLVGVILGFRAPLAILIGVTLQALLIAHGGVSTIGVNACTETLPALLVAALFPLLHAFIHGRHRWCRSLLIVSGAVLWGACLVLAVALVATHGIHGGVSLSDRAGVVFSLAGRDLTLGSLAPSTGVLIHPVTLAGLAFLGLLAVALERRWPTAPDFALGAFLGVVSVLATTLLIGIVLLADAAERWQPFVSAVLVAHLPIALVEGAILGCTLGFLSRVKPEILRLPQPRPMAVMFGLALVAVLLSAQPAFAHRLLADHKVDLKNRRVIVECYYETDDIPQEARAQVLRPDGSILAEGPLDAAGKFEFAFEKAEPLTVQVTAPGGHRATRKIESAELQGGSIHPPVDRSARSTSSIHGDAQADGDGRFRNLIVGVALLLATAAFLISWNNQQRLRRLSERLERFNGGIDCTPSSGTAKPQAEGRERFTV